VATQLVPVYGWSSGLLKSAFHSVSAFCNAGFDVFGTEARPFDSLLSFGDNPFMLLVTALLIIIGGLGVIVWSDIVTNRKFSKFSLHTKLVLVMTGALLAAGTLGILLFERNNPATLSSVSPINRLLHSFFHSVTTRTAGFNAIPVSEMKDASNFLSMMLMMVGGAPGSTAGGIKVTTLGVLILTVLSFSQGHHEVNAFRRRLTAEIITKSVTIAALALTLIAGVTLTLLGTNQISFLQALFEATSAFGTVGLSTGITGSLNSVGKLALMIAMVLGRIGPFTAVVAFATMRSDKKYTHRYAEGEISVG
jgi:trk system potassium uptake protein TrkH